MAFERAVCVLENGRSSATDVLSFFESVATGLLPSESTLHDAIERPAHSVPNDGVGVAVGELPVELALPVSGDEPWD